ncbi:methyl-accepting chemotaxis protein [Rhodoplanes sp. Z2-YC6860]|uniref:methyl-accepting chemotaxis protein n=1 Tax=Rhodoplanes sp. Z2-YC6860 TaxID=674703 RepID=UPI00078E3256|nr:methyl-accepting chemotaxis protein [Rhodoplanes sp. Z2-YC6860]AMN42540.1 methyl-accepting chemotaxis protein [Rhodoplanes sp. Z2-YC6860]
MTNIQMFQAIVAKALIALAAVHVPILMVVAWALNRDIGATMLVATVLAAAPLLAWYLRRPILIVGLALAVTLVGQTSLLVYLMAGHPWQVEMHFYYFAILAMLSGFCDWRVMIVAAGLIAVQHLSLDFVLPEAIYAGGSNFLRVLVHAVVVVIETAMLIGIGHAIRVAFAEAEFARLEAERNAQVIKRAGIEQEKELAATTLRAEKMTELLARFRRDIIGSTVILHGAADELTADAEKLGRAAAHANAQSVVAVVASENTTLKIRSAAHAGEELAQTITEVGTNAAKSSHLANSAVAEAQRTSDAIGELAAAAQEIDNVTDLIAAIASQTNLLALNATIEAARAGEMGRGFAVVAQEVKALAGQTATATQDIGRRVAAMRQATSRSVEAIAAISGTIGEVDLFSARIAAAVEQQAVAAREIAGNANSASDNVAEVGAAIIEIETVADQAARAANNLGTAASAVAEQSKKIRDQVAEFTQTIQTLQA